jgi:hypothetical protein
MRYVSDKSRRENKNKTTLFVQYLLLENRAVYEITWRNIVERGRPQMKIWRMRIAFWIHQATNTKAQVV